MNMPLGTEVHLGGVGAGHIVLDGFPALRKRDTAAPSFRPMSIVTTVAHLTTAELLFQFTVSCTKSDSD